MAHQMRINALKSAIEAAGVAMAPAADQFNGEPSSSGQAAPDVDAGNYSRAWASPRYRNGFEQSASRPNKLKGWFSSRWSRALST
jgi:hypothetical protein